MIENEYWVIIDGVRVPNEESMVAKLLDENHLFCSSRRFYCPWAKELQEETMCLFICINDVFVPASDGESLALSDLPILFDLYEKKNSDGVIEFVALKRGHQPRKRTKERMIKDKTWIKEMEELIPNRC